MLQGTADRNIRQGKQTTPWSHTDQGTLVLSVLQSKYPVRPMDGVVLITYGWKRPGGTGRSDSDSELQRFKSVLTLLEWSNPGQVDPQAQGLISESMHTGTRNFKIISSSYLYLLIKET